MPQDLKICLYLDVDMLVLQDLRQLFTLDLMGKVAGVVKDVVETRKRTNEKSSFDFGDFYFNSGFLLINLNAWRTQRVWEKCFEFLNNFKPAFPDQDALNFAIGKQNSLVLPLNFNAFSVAVYVKKYKIEYSTQEIQNAYEYPVVVHFTQIKPWCFHNIQILCLIGYRWWQIALQTPHFTDELTEILLKNQSPKIITSKILKRFLKIAAKILPSSKARKQCRRLLNEC